MSAAFLLSAALQFALALVVAALLGPVDFGAYALVLSAGVLTQTFLFDGLRLAAARFHHADADGALLARLWRLTGAMALALLVLGAGIALALPEHGRLYALVPVLAVVNAVADLTLAVLRAEFATRRFALTLLARSALAMTLVPLVAWHSHAPELALLALAAATVLPALFSIPAMRRPRGDGVGAPTLREIATYSGPIIITNGLYLGFFFGLRAGVAWFGGLAAAGQFSLALEVVLKLFSTLGTALDLALFPLALKAERDSGLEAAQNQTRTNLELVLAVLAPMALGLMLVAPGLEPLLVAEKFRGPFATYVIAICPGIALYALVQYGLHPIAQIRHETASLLKAASMALGLGAVVGVGLLSRGVAALPVGATLLAAMLGAGAMMALCAGRVALPARRYIVSLVCCLLVMGCVVTPLSLIGLSLPMLAAAITLGALTYAGGAYALDLAGIRGFLARP